MKENGQSFEFGGANVRMFYDNLKLTFKSMSCQLRGLDNCEQSVTVSSVNANYNWGMIAAQYIQYNISRFLIPGLADQTMFLDSEKILQNKNLTIINELTTRINIQSNTTGAIEIAPGAIVKIQNLNITSSTGGIPATMLNQGVLTLQKCYEHQESIITIESRITYGKCRTIGNSGFY
jgi:hypothetical protein